MVLAPFPDVNKTLRDLIMTWDATLYVGSVLPANLGPGMDQISRAVVTNPLPGSVAQLDMRVPVDITVYAPTYAGMRALVSLIEPGMLSYPHRLTDLGTGIVTVVDRVECQGFQEIPWDNSSMRTSLATFTVVMRRGTGMRTAWQ